LVPQAISQLASFAWWLGWTEQVFKSSDSAESALCTGRANFVAQYGHKALIPKDIWNHIIHPDGSTNIKGFRDLFIHLNTNADADELRRLIFDYFHTSAYWRSYLSESSCPNR